MTVPPPLYISARLMAALTLTDGSVIHVGSVASVGDDDGYRYRYIVENPDGEIIDEGSDLRCPMAEDYGEVMSALLSFLSHYAEHYAYRHMSGDPCDDDCPAPVALMEWAYGVSTDLDSAAADLDDAAE